MTDEAAMALSDAMNRLAAAIERIASLGGMFPAGIQVHHHGIPSMHLQPPMYPWQQQNFNGFR